MRGRVLLRASWNGGGWKTLGIQGVDALGKFNTTLRLGRKGSLRVRATLPETPSYIGATAAVGVRVV